MERITDKISNSRIIETTGDHSSFKLLEGNRDVVQARVNKIKESILKVGYVTSPIIVNEKMEVIDGQGRLEALKQLGRPVDYIVVPGASIKECISLNLHNTSWGLNDFIKSYATKGNENYIRLNNLLASYPHLSLEVVGYVLFGSRITGKIYKSGKINVSESAYESAKSVLDYFNKFYPYLAKRSTFRKNYFYFALNFAYHHPEIDNNKLFDKFVDQYSLLCSPANAKQGLSIIEELYNGGKTRKKVYLVTDYEKALEDKYSWYNKKWRSETV